MTPATRVKSWKAEPTDEGVRLTLNGTPFELGASAAAMVFDIAAALGNRSTPCHNELSRARSDGEDADRWDR